MRSKKLSSRDIERRLFEVSVGPLRLLDTLLNSLGKNDLAIQLRDLLTGWRAYPSLTVYSRHDLRSFIASLESIEGGLSELGQRQSADLVHQIRKEVTEWTSRM